MNSRKEAIILSLANDAKVMGTELTLNAQEISQFSDQLKLADLEFSNTNKELERIKHQIVNLQNQGVQFLYSEIWNYMALDLKSYTRYR